MKRFVWLARLAATLWPFGRIRTPESDPQKDRALAARTLKTRLPPHLRRDVGAGDE